MAETPTHDEKIVRALAEGAPGALSVEEAGAIGRVLARLDAAEKVCGLVAVSLSPKARAAATKKLYWWDVAGAVNEWEKLARDQT
jgi:hypothetical protein